MQVKYLELHSMDETPERWPVVAYHPFNAWWCDDREFFDGFVFATPPIVCTGWFYPDAAPVEMPAPRPDMRPAMERLARDRDDARRCYTELCTLIAEWIDGGCQNPEVIRTAIASKTLMKEMSK